MDHLVLIDGHHLMYRAYWAIPRTLRSKSGEQSNVAFGVASMVLAILQKEEPTHLLFTFDAGEETFRHQENATYKEGRAETPDDFYVQIPRVLELVSAFSFKEVSDKRYEADDFLCAYAREGEKKGMKVTIVTGDRDAFQLATEKIRIAIPHKGYQQAEYLGPKEIEAKYGIRPDQVASYKGLCGDSSDNLPGVKGIGPKTAAELLQKYQTLEGIYEHLEDIRPAVREKLAKDREQAFFCERMAVLKCDIDLPFALPEVALKGIDPAPVLGLFTTLDFTLLDRRFRKFLETAYGAAHFLGGSLPAEAPQQSSAAKVVPKSDSKNQLSLF